MNLEQQSRQDLNEPEGTRTFFSNPYLLLPLDSLLPTEIPIRHMRSVLDVGCGTGEWACEIAQKYPHLHINGLDTSTSSLEQAMQRASLANITTVSFLQCELSRPLSLLDQSYDIIHIHSLVSLLMTARREQLLTEIQQLLNPGGWLSVADYEQGATSSPAFNELSRISLKGLGALCGNLIPSSSNYSAGVHLYGLLVDSGLVDVSYTIHAVDYGINSHPRTPQFLSDIITDMIHFKPALLLLNLTDSETFDALIGQAQQELYSPYSCGYAYLISAVGRKERDDTSESPEP